MKKKVGELEELVLLSVAGLSSEAYTVQIQLHIESNAGRFVTMGALYTALDRLEDKGLVLSKLGEVTPQRGGRRKRFYQITSSGIQLLLDLRESRNKLWALIDMRPFTDPGHAS